MLGTARDALQAIETLSREGGKEQALLFGNNVTGDALDPYRRLVIQARVSSYPHQ